MCIIILSNNLAILKLSELTLLWQSGIYFLLYKHQFQFHHHRYPLWHGHASDIMISRILRNYYVIISGDVSMEVSSIGIGNATLMCISITFVWVWTCGIWWIICFVYFIFLIIIKETSANWNRSHWTKWHKATFFMNKQDTVSYPLPEQQSTQVDCIIWYPCSVISKSKNHSRGSKYLQYVCCLPSWYSTYLVTWSCWEVTLASLGKKLYHITYWGFVLCDE